MAQYIVYALLPVLLVIALFAHSGLSISCFVCNSHKDYDGEPCKDLTVNSTDSPLFKDCNTQSAPAGRQFTRCRIMVQEIGEDRRIIRSCATDTYQEDKHKAGECFDRTGTAKIKLRYCECEGNACNSAAALYASVITIFVAAIVGRKAV